MANSLGTVVREFPISVDEPHILKLYLDQYNTDHEPLSIPMTHIFVVLCHV